MRSVIKLTNSGFLSQLANQSSNRFSYQGFRFFSAISFKIPDQIKSEFEQVNLTKENNPFPSQELVEDVSARLIEKLEENKNNCPDSSKMLNAIYKIREDIAITAVFVENIPQGQSSPILFSDIFCNLVNLSPQISNYRTLHSLNPEIDKTDYVPPHTDGINLEGNPELSAVTIFGISKAREKLHTTYVIELDEILKRLTTEEINILEQPIYARFFNDYNSPIFVPILRKENNGSYKVSFSGNGSELMINSNMAELLHAEKALNSFEKIVSDLFKEGKMHEFQVSDGSLLLFFNTRSLHGRHLEGNTEDKYNAKNNERVLASLDYKFKNGCEPTGNLDKVKKTEKIADNFTQFR
jgi:hypothetical protein